MANGRTRWLQFGFLRGETRWGYLKDHSLLDLATRVISTLNQQPDIWVQISIPNEFQKIGKYNIGVTAGIETTICDPGWEKGANNMDLLLVSSNHSKETFLRSKFELTDEKTKQNVWKHTHTPLL